MSNKNYLIKCGCGCDNIFEYTDKVEAVKACLDYKKSNMKPTLFEVEKRDITDFVNNL